MDPSADIAAWTAVAIAAVSIVISLALYRSGQKTASRERINVYDIQTLIRILEIMNQATADVPNNNNNLPDALIKSLIATLSTKARDRLPLLQSVSLETEPRLVLHQKKAEIRAELVYAIAVTLNDLNVHPPASAYSRGLRNAGALLTGTT